MTAQELSNRLADLTSKTKCPSYERGIMNGAIDMLRQQAEQIETLKADAGRYRWLKDNRSYAYAMQPDSPAECGIEYQWQQGSYEERNWNIDSAIDDEISRAAIDAMKGAT